MPSPDRHQWQVATQAAGRGVDLTARAGRPRQKRLFRSRSEAPASLAEAAQQRGDVGGMAAEEAAAVAGEVEDRRQDRMQLLPLLLRRSSHLNLPLTTFALLH